MTTPLDAPSERSVATRIEFVSGINWRFVRHYFAAGDSLFRRYQEQFVKNYGCKVAGRIIEIGAEPHRHHRRFFPRASPYLTSNVSHERGAVDLIIDVTDMQQVPSASVDGIVCVSVVEHVPSIERAFAEIRRVLRPGGALILTVPFGFPNHDVVDYWRPNADALRVLLPEHEMNMHVLAYLGGTLSTLTSALQRPRGRLSGRYLIYKTLGVVVALVGMGLDTRDGFPLGFGVYATKR